MLPGIVGAGNGHGIGINIVLESFSTGQNDNMVASYTATLPSGIQSGDMLIAINARGSNSSSVSWPTGWTELEEYSSQWAIAYRCADGSEGASVNFGGGSNAPGVWAIARFSGVPSAISAPTKSTIATGSSASPNSSSVSSSYGFYITLFAAGNGATPTVPSGYTLIAARDAVQSGIGMAYRNTGQSSEDPGAWTLSTSQAWCAWTLGL